MENMIPQTNREIQKQLKSVLGRLGTLQTEALMDYAMSINPDQTKENMEFIFTGLDHSRGAFFTEYNVSPYPNRKIEADMAIAFWAFTLYAQDAGERFLAANWPSSIIFKTDDARRPYRITVCHSAHNDENLAVLKNKRWDGVFNEIVVGVNLSPEEIDRDLLPQGETLTFITFESEMPLTDIPKLTAQTLEVSHE